MMADIRDGRVSQTLRHTADVERLMHSRTYRLETLALDAMVALSTNVIGYPFFRIGRGVLARVKKAVLGD